MLFEFSRLRCSMRCLDSSDGIYFRGDELRPSRGIIRRHLGHPTVGITDLKDMITHLSQIHFRDSSVSNFDLDAIEETDRAGEVLITIRVAESISAFSMLWQAVGQESDIGRKLLREEGCDECKSPAGSL